MRRMKRQIICAILILLCFLLESMFLPHIALGSITPNLLLIITASFGFMRGKTEGLFIGFFSGLLCDIFFGNIIGFYALLYMLIGYVNGFFKRLFFDEDIKLPLLLIGVSDIIYGLLIYLLLFMLKSDFAFGYYLFHQILPETVYTVLTTLVVYQILLWINRKLEDEEKRGASKFV